MPLRALLRAAAAPLRSMRLLWRARRSLPYRFERARICARHGPVRRVGVPLLLIAIYAVAVFDLYMSEIFEDDLYTIIPRLVCGALLLATLVGACVAGARAFGGERDVGTLDALVMAPVSRDELVLGRFLARGRAHRFLFLAYFCVTLGAILLDIFRMLQEHGEAGWGGEEVVASLTVYGVFALGYFSLLSLGAGLG